MTEQIIASTEIEEALAGFFERIPGKGNTGNCLGPIRSARATLQVGETIMALSASVMSDNGPNIVISTSEGASGTTYYNCYSGVWTTAGRPLDADRAAALCEALSIAVFEQ